MSAEPPAVTPGTVDGLAYALVHPTGPCTRRHRDPATARGSCKENHLDFARRCAAAGIAAIAFDQRGHGPARARSARRCSTTSRRSRRCCPPGRCSCAARRWAASSRSPRQRESEARAVVAICPASGAQLAAGVRAGRFDFRADVPALEALLAGVDLDGAARALGPDLLLLHAEDDDRRGRRALRPPARAGPRQQLHPRARRRPRLGPARPRAARGGRAVPARAHRLTSVSLITRGRRERATSRFLAGRRPFK